MKDNDMLNRYANNPRVLRDAVMEQQCVAHCDAIADAICGELELVALEQGDSITVQGGHDNDIFLILAGRVSIQVNQREMAIRQAGQHIGEMVTIDPAAKRSATTIALEETVVAKVSEPAFATIADAHPLLWRRLAKELGDRLRERTKFVMAPNPRPVLFIGSSTEGLAIANEIQAGLSHDDVLPTVWTNSVFIPGHGTMEDLEMRIRSADFGILVCTPDDKIVNEDRGVNGDAPRDNVILELGMCLGALGCRRTLLVRPRTKNLKIPTDMLGITPIDYQADDPENLATHIGPVCNAIRQVINKEGVRLK